MSRNDPEAVQPGYHSFPHPSASTPLNPSYDSRDDLSPAAYPHTSAAELNYYNRRSEHLDAYNDPYSSLSPQRDGPVVGMSSVSIGPWDSASQRSISDVSYQLPPSHNAPLSDSQGGLQAGRHVKNKASNMTAGGLSYIDEDGDYYRSPHHRPASAHRKREDELEMHGLVSGAAGMGRRGSDPEHAVLNGTYGEGKYGQFEDGPLAWPPLGNVSTGLRQESKLMALLLFPTGLDRVLGLLGWEKAKVPIDQAIERKKRGVPGQRWPVVTWLLTAGQYVCLRCRCKLTEQSWSG
jgi:hypothetical protein